MTRCQAASLCGAVALCALLGSTSARADATADQRAAAQALFDDARRLINEKHWSEACPKLEESQRLDPGLGTLLNLAECQAQIGKTASAWANFLEAAYQAKAAGQTKRETTARAKAAALEPRLSKLTILAVPTTGVTVEIRRDGVAVHASLVGTAVPVDPGEHVISASGAGKRPWSTKVVVSAEGQQLTVSIPQLEDAAPDKPAEPPAGIVPPPPPPPVVKPPPVVIAPPLQPPPPPADPGGSARAAGGVLTAFGLAGVGAGAAFTILAKQKLNDSNQDGCNATTNVCTNPNAASERNTARTYGAGATAGFIAGGVVAAGGIALLAVAAHAKPKPVGTTMVVPSVATDERGGWIFGLGGRF